MGGFATCMESNTSGPTGKALYAKYKMSSLHVHKLQNCILSENVKRSLWKEIRSMVWTRLNINTDSSYIRTHIAHERISQSFRYGGMSVISPLIQQRGLAIGWIRKIYHCTGSNMAWITMLDYMLSSLNLPKCRDLLKLGSNDWIRVSERMRNHDAFWSAIFLEGSKLMSLLHRRYRHWHVIPLTQGDGQSSNNVDISTISYFNPN